MNIINSVQLSSVSQLWTESEYDALGYHARTTSKIIESNTTIKKVVNWRAREEVQEHRHYENMSHHSVNLVKHETSLGVPNLRTLPTWLKPSVKDFIFFWQVMSWTPEGLFQLLLSSTNKTRLGRWLSHMPMNVQLLSDGHVTGVWNNLRNPMSLIVCFK